MPSLFLDALQRKNKGRPPVWFMRQAGRYHSHYQNLRKRYSFMELCKIPEVACEVTMGPIQDFNFDAAILFSDLLFPLEVMGTGLSYGDSGPKLGWHLREVSDLKKLKGGAMLAKELHYQAEALQLIRKKLDPSKGLLGFVGGPLTLFMYAVEGSHKGDLTSGQDGLFDGRYEGFVEKLHDLLVENIILQAEAGADCVAIMDTCAGEISVSDFQKKAVPALRSVCEAVKRRHPSLPLLYYSKGTNSEYWRTLDTLPFEGLGVDWRTPLPEILRNFGGKWAIQGNFDPNLMLLPWSEIEKNVRAFFEEALKVPSELRQGWICGLGHGILPKTPEDNVRNFLKLQKEYFQ